MYDSVIIPAEIETSAPRNSHRGSWEDTLSRHKIKAAVATALLFVLALVGLSNTKTTKSTSAYLEVKEEKIDPGETVLTKFAIQGIVSGAYITHSSDQWNIHSNIGIFGTGAVTTEEQWDFHTNSTWGYYKLVHSHDDVHWLTLQGAPDFNPTVLHAPKTIYDKQGFIRWSLATNADGSGTISGTPATGPGTIYYIVNLLRDRCLAILTAVTDPTSATYDQLQDSVKSYAKDAAGNFPDDCKVQLLDAANAPEASHGHGFWHW